VSHPNRELALFPLNTVLFPGGPLPLRIFEPRYVDMVRRCLREERGFGVILIERGAEAGGPAEFSTLGTEARIVDFSRMEDGLLGITCLGQQRIRVVEAWRQPDGLNVGRVLDVEPDPAVPIPPEYERLAEVVRHVLKEFGQLYRFAVPAYDDAAWVGNRLAELLPLSPTDKQALLELSDPLERLAALAPVVQSPRDGV
jgi:hypothetical protein